MTTEQKLSAIIEAQDRKHPRQGIGAFQEFDDPNVYFAGIFSEESRRMLPYVFHILTILLDPERLKAVYGTERKFYSHDGIHATGEDLEYWMWVGRGIALAWLSEGAVAAIDIAFYRLP